MLTGAFFMLQIYDRVLPGKSVSTLIALAILAAGLLLAQGMLDAIRSRILSRIGGTLDEALSARVYDTIVRLPLKANPRGDGLQPLRDLDSIRSFLSSQGPAALFDLPWIPIYLLIIYAFHPMLGLTALIGALVLVTLTLLTEFLTRKPLREATEAVVARNGLAQAGRRNAEILASLGMSARIGARWATANTAYQTSNRRASDVAGTLGAFSRSLRMILQSAVLGVGAYFVIQGQATPGIIIAGSVLVARALAPIDLAISNWRNFIAARQSWRRLTNLLAVMPASDTPMALPAPQSTLTVASAGIVPPGERESVVQDVTFSLSAGDGLGIVGPSGSGKSSLARALVGVWQPARGAVRLDGAALSQWSLEALGTHIGYLPQNIELFDGTIADNIARFDPEAKADDIVAAAKAAGVHDLIVSLQEGYDTEIGEQGRALSAGQRQRVALARALYRDPFLLVLDEPNSNLDSDGEAALSRAIRGVRARGGIAIIIAHRKSALAEVDHLLVMAAGNAISFGDKETILANQLRAAVQARKQSAEPSRNASITPQREGAA